LLRAAANPPEALELKGNMRSDSTSVRENPIASVAVVEDKIRTLSLFILTILGLLLGIVTGIGAVLFRDLINLLHNLFFAGHFALAYDANVFSHPDSGSRRRHRHLPVRARG